MRGLYFPPIKNSVASTRQLNWSFEYSIVSFWKKGRKPADAEKFITTREIGSFESLAKITADREQRYQQLETAHPSKGPKLNRLKAY